MDIFIQLGADSSIMYQFGIMLVILILSKFLFLNHLQNVLESRENKTTKLEGSADKQFEEVERLEKVYKEKMSNANKEVRDFLDAEKTKISRENEAKYKEEEKTANAEVDSKRKEAQAEAQAQKESILSNTDELSDLLVQKITKG